MTKQEFLAMSLPYKLYVIDDEINETFQVAGYREDSDELLIYDNNDGSVEEYCENLLKPILRPLSDLIKEIEHKGETFVPIDELNNIGDAECDRYNDYFNEENISDVNWLLEPFIIFQKLIEWHFAVGLNSDDYIDLNSLEANPYK